MASVRGILNIQSLNELTYENVTCIAVRKLGTECDADGRMYPRRSTHEIDETGANVSTGVLFCI